MVFKLKKLINMTNVEKKINDYLDDQVIQVLESLTYDKLTSDICLELVYNEIDDQVRDKMNTEVFQTVINQNIRQ